MTQVHTYARMCLMVSVLSWFLGSFATPLPWLPSPCRRTVRTLCTNWGALPPPRLCRLCRKTLRCLHFKIARLLLCKRSTYQRMPIRKSIPKNFFFPVTVKSILQLFSETDPLFFSLLSTWDVLLRLSVDKAALIYLLSNFFAVFKLDFPYTSFGQCFAAHSNFWWRWPDCGWSLVRPMTQYYTICRLCHRTVLL